MPLLLDIWSVLSQKKAGGGMFPDIPITGAGGVKLYALVSSGQVPFITSKEMAVGIMNTLTI